jgi:hypothetical protein
MVLQEVAHNDIPVRLEEDDSLSECNPLVNNLRYLPEGSLGCDQDISLLGEPFAIQSA